MRARAGLSQGELAAKVSEVHSTFISQIETGRAVLPSNKIGDVASALGLDRSELATKLLSFYDPGMFSAVFDLSPEEAPAPSEADACDSPEPRPSLIRDLIDQLEMNETPLTTDALFEVVREKIGDNAKRTTVYVTLYRLWKRGRVARDGEAWMRAPRPPGHDQRA